MKVVTLLRRVVPGFLACALTTSLAAQDADPVRALLVTGGHPYDVAEFHHMFDSMEGIDFTHVELQDHSEIFDDISDWSYDAIVFFNMTSQLSDGRLQNLIILTEWGVGLVPLHHGTLSWTSQPFVRENIFGVQFPDAGPFGFHIGERFTCNIVDGDHPITHGMADFDVIDETYTNYYGKGQPGNRVLITTSHQPADPELVWVRQLNNSRIANIQGGHDRLMYENPDFANLIRRSVLWTAGRLPAEVGGDPLQSGSIFRESARIPGIIAVLSRRTADDSRQIETGIETMLLRDAISATERTQLLDGLLEVASDTKASEPARSFALRQLGSHAEPRQLEGIVALLEDDVVSNMARYALEQIGHPRAAELLRGAISETHGDIRRGVVFSLGRLKDEESRLAIAELLSSEDPLDVESAASALGLIGGLESVALLQRAHQAINGVKAISIENGLLTAAETLPESDAQEIHEELRANGSTSPIRAAAWRGSLLSSTADASLMKTALSHEDPHIRDVVIRAIPWLTFNDLNAVLLETWPSLSVQEMLGVLHGLEERGESEGLEVIHAALGSEDSAVRESSLYVAGTIGTRETARLLLAMMPESQASERRLMADALSSMPSEGIDELLLESLQEEHSSLRADIVAVLANRGAAQHMDAILAIMGDEDRDVRRAAFDAVSRIGSDSEVSSLIAFILESDSTPDRREASRALIALVADSEIKDQHLADLVVAVEKGDDPAAETLLPAVAALGTPAAGDTLMAMLDADREGLRLGAIRSLSEWKDASPIEALLAVAQDREGREATLASRGYLRLISTDPNLHRHEKMAAAARIQPYLRDSGSKTQLVGLASGIPTKDSLDIIASYLDDADVQREAVFAMVRLTDGLWADFPEEVRSALNVVIESEYLSDDLRAEARRGLDSIEKYADRILANWTFTDDIGGWQALNQSRIEVVNGTLVIHCEGDDPFIGVDVEIPEQPMVIQLRVRYTDPQAFQFFTHTTERPITDPASVVSIVPDPSTGDWVEYELNLDPKGTILEFRFDPALKPGIVELDYIRLLKR